MNTSNSMVDVRSLLDLEAEENDETLVEEEDDDDLGALGKSYRIRPLSDYKFRGLSC